MKPVSPALPNSDALATVITSLFVNTSIETWPLRGPCEMKLAVICLKLHLTVFGLHDHLSVPTSFWGGQKALLRIVSRELSVVNRELSVVAASVSAAQEALGRADEFPAFVDPAIFWLNDRLAWEFPAMTRMFESI